MSCGDRKQEVLEILVPLIFKQNNASICSAESPPLNDPSQLSRGTVIVYKQLSSKNEASDTQIDKASECRDVFPFISSQAAAAVAVIPADDEDIKLVPQGFRYNGNVSTREEKGSTNQNMIYQFSNNCLNTFLPAVNLLFLGRLRLCAVASEVVQPTPFP